MRIWLFAGVIFAGLASACSGGTSSSDAPRGDSSSTNDASSEMALLVGGSSDALPMNATCRGAGVSPAVRWSGAPAGTVSYAIVMHSPPDSPAKWWWLIYDIPPSVGELPEDVSTIGTLGLNGVHEEMALGFEPPCPQGAGTHTYAFTIYALSAASGLSDPSSVSQGVLQSAIADKTLGSKTIVVSYTFDETSGPKAP